MVELFLYMADFFGGFKTDMGARKMKPQELKEAGLGNAWNGEAQLYAPAGKLNKRAHDKLDEEQRRRMETQIKNPEE